MSADDGRDIIDIASLPKSEPQDGANIGGTNPPRADLRSDERSRPFIGVHFKCCGVYQRLYKSGDAARYEGRCPKCARSVCFLVGAGGTDARMFVVE